LESNSPIGSSGTSPPVGESSSPESFPEPPSLELPPELSPESCGYVDRPDNLILPPLNVLPDLVYFGTSITVESAVYTRIPKSEVVFEPSLPVKAPKEPLT